MDCLDLIQPPRPLSPSAVARRAGLHPATYRHLDRLERAGWVAVNATPAEPTRITVGRCATATGSCTSFCSEMNSSMDEICTGYDEAQLELVAPPRRTTEAGRDATTRTSRRVTHTMDWVWVVGLEDVSPGCC